MRSGMSKCEPTAISLLASPGRSNGPTAVNDPLPKLQVDEPIYKFDSMQRGTKKSHEFEIKNVGQAH